MTKRVFLRGLQRGRGGVSSRQARITAASEPEDDKPSVWSPVKDFQDAVFMAIRVVP